MGACPAFEIRLTLQVSELKDGLDEGLEVAVGGDDFIVSAYADLQRGDEFGHSLADHVQPARIICGLDHEKQGFGLVALY